MNYLFLRYNLAAYIVEAAPDERINKLILMQPHLQTLLVGEVGEVRKNGINVNYSNADQLTSNADKLQIYNLLHKWTNKDLWTLASSLYLPSYKSAT